jgi:DNA-binding Lrp family transcriptional regulator
MPRGRAAIDDLDRRLTERLWIDGRESTRSLARALEVSEATVATRLRRLERDGAMRVVAVTDFERFGYPVLGFVAVSVAGRSAADVAHDIARVPVVISVSVTIGTHPVMAVVLARSTAELGDVVAREVAGVPGVTAVRTDVGVTVRHFEFNWGALATPVGPAGSVPPITGLDELNAAILAALQHDARTSNRRIAQALDVNEGTVRARLKRLEDEGFVRIQAIADFEAFGGLSAAVVGVRVAGGEMAAVERSLAGLPENMLLARTVGGWNFVAITVARSREALLRTVLEEIPAIPHVHEVDVMEIATSTKHVYTWAKIGDRRG